MVDWASSSKKSPNANKKVEPCKGILLNGSFRKNVLLITVHAVQKPITGGFQMKIGFTTNFVKIELECWGFPALRRRRSSKHRPPASPAEFPERNPIQQGRSLRRNISKGQKGKLRNNERLSNLSLPMSALRGSA